MSFLRLSVLTVFCLSVFLTGCNDDMETNVEKGYRTKTLYIGNGTEPETLDPHLSTGDPEYHIQLALFEGLVMKNQQTLDIEPAVAEDWTVSADKLTYTFTLRKNARWSNGDPVTAEDFVNSWYRALSPEIHSDYAYIFFYIKNAEKFYKGEIEDFSKVGITAINEHTLEIVLQSPTPFFLQLLDHHSFYPVNKKAIEASGNFLDPENPWTRADNFVGNGPFTLDAWDVSRALEVKRNPYYWGQESIHLKRIVFLPIENKLAEERAFRSGQIHLTTTPQMAPEKITAYEKDNPSALQIIPAYSSYYYLLNTKKKPFNDVRVRRALAMAIDRKKLVKDTMKGGEAPAYSVVPGDPEGFVPDQQFTFDPERARQLLAEAGYPEGKGFPVTEILFNSSDLHKSIAVAVQKMLKAELNIEVNVFHQEWKMYLKTRKDMSYQIARAGWIGDYLDPSNFFEIFLSYSENNHTGWANPEYDALVKSAQTIGNQEKRFALFEHANALLAEGMPAIPLFYYSDVNFVLPTVTGWHPNVMQYHRFQGVDFTVTPEKLHPSSTQ